MIPINDCEPNRYIRLPIMTLALISMNGLVFLFTAGLVGEQGSFIALVNRYGSIPANTLSGKAGSGLTSLSYMFIHGGPWHLLGNMLGLWVFGRRVEDLTGPSRFLVFYLICGVLADLLSTIVQPDSTVPSIGASGAVFGVMGAHVILFPKGRIRTLVPLWFVPLFPRIRAYWLVLYLFVLELPPAFEVLFNHAQYRIGHWAHVGGFLASLLVLLFLRPEAFHRYRNELPL